MKKVCLSFLVIVAAFFTYAQDTKNLVYDANAEKRNVGEFNALDISSAITVYISQGNETGVAISVENGEKDKVKTEVRNGVLKIYVESGFWGSWRDSRVKAYVTVKQLQKIIASGASSIRITDKLTAGHLKIGLSGASNLKGEINADELKFELTGASTIHSTIHAKSTEFGISGASTANLTGNTGELDVEASGASNFKAFDLVAEICGAEASGASSVRVNCTKHFNKLQASGASSIHYKGTAEVKNFESSGASSIKKDA